MDPLSSVKDIPQLLDTMQAIGGPLQWAVGMFAIATAIVAIAPGLARWRGAVLGGMAGLLLAGELLLAWFHFRLWQLAPVVEPASGRVTGHMAISLWVEGERLYVWALTVAVLGVLMRKEREKLLPGVMLATSILAIADMITGSPFTNPVPKFLSQYAGYVQAYYQGGTGAEMAWRGMEAARQYFYGAWFMWVHPPLLYFSYGAFTLSFVAIVRMVIDRRTASETAAYVWARLGYLPLTVGMLLGFPWALEAWTGQSWWWSGFINMSIMMWFLYTGYLHARLYLRRRGMWRTVAILAILSFASLVLTYVTTYVVPGTHSYAASAPAPAEKTATLPARGGRS